MKSFSNIYNITVPDRHRQSTEFDTHSKSVLNTDKNITCFFKINKRRLANGNDVSPIDGRRANSNNDIEQHIYIFHEIRIIRFTGRSGNV